MRRRDFFRSAFGCLAAPIVAVVAPSKVATTTYRHSFDGMLVRYPPEKVMGTLTPKEWAKRIAEDMKRGAMICFPSAGQSAATVRR